MLIISLNKSLLQRPFKFDPLLVSLSKTVKVINKLPVGIMPCLFHISSILLQPMIGKTPHHEGGGYSMCIQPI